MLTPYEKTIETINKKAAQAAAALERAKANPADTAATLELLKDISDAIAYHKTGKIEGIFSLDSSCRACDFCQRMQASEDPEVICRFCYAAALHETAQLKHETTARILSEKLYTREELQAVPVPIGLLRFDCDGELINVTHARNVIRLTDTHPAVRAGIWTKRPGILKQAIDADGKPDNLKVGISSPLINCPFEGSFSFADFIFTVYTPEGMKRALARGEHECNGKKCRDCGFYCYTATKANSSGPARIAEALRRPYNVSKANFEELCAMIDARTLD